MIAKGQPVFIPEELEQCPVFLKDTRLVNDWNKCRRKWEIKYPDVNIAEQTLMAHNSTGLSKYAGYTHWKRYLGAWFRHKQEEIIRSSGVGQRSLVEELTRAANAMDARAEQGF
jgi:hypothetical protein